MRVEGALWSNPLHKLSRNSRPLRTVISFWGLAGDWGRVLPFAKSAIATIR
jgi:hypothetical protein